MYSKFACSQNNLQGTTDNKVKAFNKVLFFMSSYRSNEMKQQLITMGADVHKIIELPTEQQLWNGACKKLHSMTANKERLTQVEHRKVLLSLLKEFKNYCEKKGLRYYLGYGTLIGAVRHKGFIPWDDDIDILMPVEDYNKFIREYQGDRKFEVLDYKINDEYFFPFAKFVDNSTYLHHAGCPITWMQEVYIDIFPMSGFEDELGFEEQWKYHTLLDVKWYWYYLSRDVVLKKEKDCRDEILREKHKRGYNHANKVGVLTTIPAKPWMLKKEVFNNVCKLNFEGDFYNAPLNYDTYLKEIYGDYMKLPSTEEQKNHDFPSYRRLIPK